AEQPDDLHRDHAPRERGLADADHRVERVAVLGQRVGDEAVVGGIDDRAEQEAIEGDRLQLLVPLVLVAAALRDLDEAVQVGHSRRCYYACDFSGISAPPLTLRWFHRHMAGFPRKRVIAIGAAVFAVAAGGGAAVAATTSSSSPNDFLDSVAKHLGISRQKLD